jgi:hypothetical protein
VIASQGRVTALTKVSADVGVEDDGRRGRGADAAQGCGQGHRSHHYRMRCPHGCEAIWPTAVHNKHTHTPLHDTRGFAEW